MFDNSVFVEQLIRKAMPDLDDNEREKLQEEVEEVVFDRVIKNIDAKMDDKQAEGFMQLVEKKVPEKEIYSYLTKIIPDYKIFLEKTYNEFETMYLKECETQDEEDEEDDE